MSTYTERHKLTPERLENLRRVVTGVTRVRGLPWSLSRTQLAWFVREGWLVAGPHAEPSDKRRTAGEVARTVAPTQKALDAIAEWERGQANAWQTARREMMP